MKKSIELSKPFLYSCLFFWLACVYLTIAFDKGIPEVYINRHSNSILDFIFKYITFMGDGLFHAILIIIFFFVNRRFFWSGLISFVFIAILSPFFKHVLFSKTARPAAFLHYQNLHFVDGVKILYSNSFPSGHTMTAFAWGLWLAVYFKEKWYWPVFFIGALSVAFSRVYLLQHFVSDVFGGSILGVICMLLSFYVYDKIIQWKRK